MARSASWVGAVLIAGLFGLGFAPAVEFGSSWLGETRAAAFYLTLTTAAYAYWLGSSRSPRLAAMLLVVAVGLTSAVLSTRLLPTALLLTGALGVGRARILFRKRLERPWLVEFALGAAALVAAWFVGTPSLGGIALSVWAYWLVQSAFLLLLLPRMQASTLDPFDVALERASELMDDVSPGGSHRGGGR